MGTSLKKRVRGGKWLTRGDQAALMSEIHSFIFKWNLYTFFVHRGKWKMQGHTESAQHSSSIALIETMIFLHTFSTKDVVYSIFWPWRPVNILWPSFDKGCSTKNLFSLKVFFLYISNLCQPQKMPNRVMFFTEQGAVSYKKEPISSKVWYG